MYLMDYFSNFSKHELIVLPDDGVTVTPKLVGAVLMLILM